MQYIIDNQDVKLLNNKTKSVFYKLEILNSKNKIVDLIECYTMDININIDSKSSVRRTASISLIPKKPSLYISNNACIWYNKRIRPYIGYEINGSIKWYLLGTMVYNQAVYNYDSSINKLTLSCSDLMCTLNGTLGGTVEGNNFTINAGEDARTVIIDTLALVNITEYNISGIDYDIEYEIKFEANTNAYTIIDKIVKMYPNYEMFFDIYGTFTIQHITDNYGSNNVLNNDILNKIVISESNTISLDNLYNHIQVYGKEIESDFYCETITSTNSVYSCTIDNYTSYENFDIVSLKLPSTNTATAFININSLGNRKIVDSNGNGIALNLFITNEIYTFKYRTLTNDFLYLGQYQAFGEAKADESSDYAISKIGDLLKVCSGGDYDMITNNEIAKYRADKELYDSLQMQNTITLSLILIPWLDVNMKIKYTSLSTKLTDEYLINSISFDSNNNTMNMSIIKFYDNYDIT